MNSIFAFVKDKLLSGMALHFNMTHGRCFDVTEYTVSEDESCIKVKYLFDFDDIYFNCIEVSARAAGETLIFSIDASRDYIASAVRGFQPERALSFELCRELTPEAMLVSSHEGAVWMMPSFPKSVSEIPEETQFLSLLYGGQSYCLLPLCGENFRCELFGNSLALSSGAGGLFSLKGDFLAVSADTDPLKAVEKCYRGAREGGGITVPLKDERAYPRLFDGLGWCTWDTFYHEVTSEGIYSKLREFREKNVPVKWVIIDDGWSSFENRQLTSFEEDRRKFPEGLSSTVARMKSEFGVERVGVWIALEGYWAGIKEGSPVSEAQKENIFKAPCGMTLPSLDEERAFAFWDAWFGYLADCGVDFVKVDNQSSLGPRIEGTLPTVTGARFAHRALERSVKKHFGGDIINCMGMDMENVLSRPETAISRNSDDFYPERHRGFIKHLIQNVYNAVWHGKLYYCDFDMWWTCHESALQSGVLRAISGSPVYVSDPVGKTAPEMLSPVTEDDGVLMRCDNAALPTLDCFYLDCVQTGKPLKVWNRSGDAFAVALFNVLEEEVTEKLYFDSIPDIDKCREYVAYEYFTKKYYRFKSGDSIESSLQGDGVAVFSLYPIYTENGAEYADIGDTTKYVPIASESKVKTEVAKIFA